MGKHYLKVPAGKNGDRNYPKDSKLDTRSERQFHVLGIRLSDIESRLDDLEKCAEMMKKKFKI